MSQEQIQDMLQEHEARLSRLETALAPARNPSQPVGSAKARASRRLSAAMARASKTLGKGKGSVRSQEILRKLKREAGSQGPKSQG